MPTQEINGVNLSYTITGDGPQRVAITPGGRFSKDVEGVRNLAAALAEGGCTVLTWDRPNCGESDICFNDEHESIQNANMLAGLIRSLDFGPCLIMGGSGGARETLLTAIHHPDVAEKVFVLWLSGGGIGVGTLPVVYNMENEMAAAMNGMEAVADLPAWKEVQERNPGNRDRFLAMDADNFCQTMRKWGDAFLPAPGEPISCTKAGDLESIKVPVTVLRSGESDMHHPRWVSEAVAAKIPGAELREPPWGDREWITRCTAGMTGETDSPFTGWPQLAPMILEFAAK